MEIQNDRLLCSGLINWTVVLAFQERNANEDPHKHQKQREKWTPANSAAANPRNESFSCCMYAFLIPLRIEGNSSQGTKQTRANVGDPKQETIITTSKALVTTSDAPVTSSFLCRC